MSRRDRYRLPARGAATVGLALTLAFASQIPHRCGAMQMVMLQDNMIQFTEQSFVQNVFGTQRTYTAARLYCEQALQLQIEFIENAVTLTKGQRSKLELAGRGDIHRFFTDFETVKRGLTFGSIPRDEWQQVWQKAQPLSARYSEGLHGERSLLEKTIASTLEPEQLEQFNAMQNERERMIYADNIRMTLALLDRKVPLTRKQREQITELLLRESEPPEYYGQNNMRFYVVLIELAKLPGEDVREIFTDAEWPVINGMLRQAKAMERTLRLQREALGR